MIAQTTIATPLWMGYAADKAKATKLGIAMYRILVGLIASISAAAAVADTITFTNGNSLDCTVLQDDDATVTVLYRSGVMRFPHTELRDVTKDAPAQQRAASNQRLPNYKAVLIQLASQKWGDKFQQIPATVIDTGIMRHVPYKSCRASTA